jgi:hypothetical protein
VMVIVVVVVTRRQNWRLKARNESGIETVLHARYHRGEIDARPRSD